MSKDVKLVDGAVPIPYPLLIFCLLILLVTEREMLMFPNIIVELSVTPFEYISLTCSRGLKLCYKVHIKFEFKCFVSCSNSLNLL